MLATPDRAEMTVIPIAPLASGISTLPTAEITAQVIMYYHLVISAFGHDALLGSITKGR